MRLPAVKFDDPSVPVPWTTKMRRLSLLFGAMAIIVGFAATMWWLAVLGGAGILTALFMPSSASLRAMRAVEQRKALGEAEE
jgi:uncharacterized membrane protein